MSRWGSCQRREQVVLTLAQRASSPFPGPAQPTTLTQTPVTTGSSHWLKPALLGRGQGPRPCFLNLRHNGPGLQLGQQMGTLPGQGPGQRNRASRPESKPRPCQPAAGLQAAQGTRPAPFPSCTLLCRQGMPPTRCQPACPPARAPSSRHAALVLARPAMLCPLSSLAAGTARSPGRQGSFRRRGQKGAGSEAESPREDRQREAGVKPDCERSPTAREAGTQTLRGEGLQEAGGKEDSRPQPLFSHTTGHSSRAQNAFCGPSANGSGRAVGMGARGPQHERSAPPVPAGQGARGPTGSLHTGLRCPGRRGRGYTGGSEQHTPLYHGRGGRAAKTWPGLEGHEESPVAAPHTGPHHLEALRRSYLVAPSVILETGQVGSLT